MRGIYSISCTAEDRVYIGSSINIDRRWQEHRRRLNKGAHHCEQLQLAWDAYGDESFTFAVVELCENIVLAEQYWLDKYLHHCYNTSLQANNPMANPEIVQKVLASRYDNYTSKLSKQQVLEIVELLESNTVEDIADMFMVSTGLVYKIRSGERWSNLTGINSEDSTRKRRLAETDVIAIKLRLRDTSDTAETIAKDYCVQKSMIAAIRSGRRWADVKVEGFVEGKKRKSTDCIEQILQLKSQGLTHVEIAQRLELSSPSSVSYALSKVAPGARQTQF